MRRHPFAGQLYAAMGVLSVSISVPYAATLTVTNANDSGPGSLRDAVATAASGDEIRFDGALTGQAISLTTGEIVIGKDVSLVGRGVEDTIILGSDEAGYPQFPFPDLSKRVFQVESTATVKIEGVTLAQGSNGVAPGGGAILNRGALTLLNSRLLQNFSVFGSGGIHNERGVLHVFNTSFEGNQGAQGGIEFNSGGGALANWSGRVEIVQCRFAGNLSRNGAAIFNASLEGLAEVTVQDSVIEQNLALHRGGGIYNAAPFGSQVSLLKVHHSVIRRNSVSADEGGGIQNYGLLEVNGSAIVDNLGNHGGGGIANEGEASIRNSTIQGNYVGLGHAGGVANRGVFVLDASTISGNIGNGGGCGIENVGIARIKNSLLIGNLDLPCLLFSGGTQCGSDCAGTFESEGANLVGTLQGQLVDGSARGTVCFGFSQDFRNDLVDVEVQDVLEVAPREFLPLPVPLLGDNGGATPTVALIPGSPVIDFISSSDCTTSNGEPITTDQRGVPRPQGAGCDIGAFEFSIPRGANFWAQQCRGEGSREYSSEALKELLSQVSAKYSASASCVLVDCDLLTHGQPAGSLQGQVARELLASWLNLASGKLTLGRPIALGALTDAATAGAALDEVEGVVCDPQASRDALLAARNIARALNGDGNR
jgi:hypothetical protein